MSYVQVSFEEAGANKIRSYLKTLIGYHGTSMRLHGRSVESVYVYASFLGDLVDEIEDTYAGFPEVARWATKFRQFVKDHGLDETRPTD